jgi:hypothetical protein
LCRTTASLNLARALAIFFILAAGCSKAKLGLSPILNQRPSVRLTQAPASAIEPYFYSYEVFWSGSDADGQVDHFIYSIDPPTHAAAETAWVATEATRATFRFRSGDPDSLGTPSDPGGFHVFVIKAVDNAGLESPVVSRAFFSFTIAPTVRFLSPLVRPLLQPSRPPATTIVWTGDDPDGIASSHPIYYRYRLIPDVPGEFPFSILHTDPDSLRRFAAPSFAGWDSVSGDTVSLSLSNLTPGRSYILAVVAFDEAGAYSAVFSGDGNLLEFTCSVQGNLGPRLSLWNPYFRYTYASGGFTADPSTFLRIQVPRGQPIPFNWSAITEFGTAVQGYRWVLDISRLEDETPRSNERTDVEHWSTWSTFGTSATVGPFTGDGTGTETHTFYVEAEDASGFTSLGAVTFQVVEPSFEHDLLFVNDTRRFPDGRSPQRADSVVSPGGLWPSAAELDTFLFARGGVRWRSYPPGQTSSPGVFAGYAFDTIGTRGFGEGGIPIALLARYRHVVWLSDLARDYRNPPYTADRPMPVLRWMNQAGQANALAIYSKLGGSLWLMGGGIAYNSLLPWNPGTDATKIVYSSAAGQLVPGRLMYDLAHWQSELTIHTPGRVKRNPGLAAGWPGAPDYSLLPAVLNEKTSASDPVPPLRSAGTFYSIAYDGEYLSQPDSIVEDFDPDPSIDDFHTALDTLCVTNGGFVPSGKPIMTYYHGVETGPVLMSGFPLWFFQRQQGIQLADFVLQEVWHLTRSPASRAMQP